MKKFLKWLFISLFIITFLALAGVSLYISSIYINALNIPLNEEILTNSSLTLDIFDSENKPIKEQNEVNHAYTNIESLKQHTLDAFISIEDKNFYTHKGINVKRMAKAGLNNIKSRSLKEGASTIKRKNI